MRTAACQHCTRTSAHDRELTANEACSCGYQSRSCPACGYNRAVSDSAGLAEVRQSLAYALQPCSIFSCQCVGAAGEWCFSPTPGSSWRSLPRLAWKVSMCLSPEPLSTPPGRYKLSPHPHPASLQLTHTNAHKLTLCAVDLCHIIKHH